MITRTVWRVNVWEVGNAQERIAQLCIDTIKLGLQNTLGVSEGTTCRHRLFSFCILAIAAQPCDLFAEFVNRGTKGVTLSRNIS